MVLRSGRYQLLSHALGDIANVASARPGAA